MRNRLVVLSKLLHQSGSIFIHIDDSELGYLIALADEVFDRKNRVSVIAFKQSSASGPKAINPGLATTTNFILYYAKNKECWVPNRVFVPIGRDDRYSKYIVNFKEPYHDWKLINLKDAFCSHHSASWTELKVRFADKLEQRLEEFVLDHAERVVRTARVAPKDVNESARSALIESQQRRDVVYKVQRVEKDDYFFMNGEQLVFYKSKTRKIDGKLVTVAAATNQWDDLLSNNLHNEGAVSFPNGKKPEALLKRVFELAAQRNDWVLDSFLGSGTTAAVAHKMGLRWIGIELGAHCDSHCLQRLRVVCDGLDQTGISKAVEWKGGGGFKYYDLAPSLLKKDKHGNYVISEEYNADMLAAAMAKQEGFTYAPSQECYWKQGFSTEQDFIFTTTNHVTQAMLDQIAEELAEGEHLLICCKKFSAGCDKRHPSIQVKKIPTMLMGRCEFGKEDYSLNIVNLTDEANAPAFVPQGPKEEPSGKAPARTHGNKNPNQMELF